MLHIFDADVDVDADDNDDGWKALAKKDEQHISIVMKTKDPAENVIGAGLRSLSSRFHVIVAILLVARCRFVLIVDIPAFPGLKVLWNFLQLISPRTCTNNQHE